MVEENILDKNVFARLAKNRKNRARLQILVVEDDDFSRTLVTRTLSGYEVLTAADGKTTLTEYTINAPDIVFLDFELPDMTGLDILKKIKQVDPDAFVVMLTSHTETNIVQQSIANGAKGYIAKPFNKAKILSYIEQFQKRESS